ncbi:B3 domain-containing protein [Thalictrum thalictroides]|uniref:B3 domain-containing protein n=1 Tax=Thalictrum thalictroides TaxID=46969 RepID=A0A7J6UTM7_THATH|nr:B3 domain-containing protein [Thalictrum thalictroides]
MMDTFFTVLMPGSDFKQKLALSTNFVTQYGSKLPETVGLSVSSTGKAWNVGLTRTNEDTFFEHGWKQFAVENSLEENDFLVFKFSESDSCFDVLLFDKTACGKQTVVASVDKDSLASLQITKDFSDDVLSGQNSGNSSESSENTSDRSWHNSDSSSSSVKGHKRGTGKSNFQGNGKSTIHCRFSLCTSRKLSYRRCFQSQRRPVTTVEKVMALQKALTVRSTRPYFIKVMTPSHVYRRIIMALPAKLVKQKFFRVPVTALLLVTGS